MSDAQGDAVRNVHDAPWGNMPVLSPQAARAYSRLAALCGLRPWRVEALGERYRLQWRAPLPVYPVTFHLRCAGGRIRIGCDLAGLLPELSAPGLRKVLEAHDHDARPWLTSFANGWTCSATCWGRALIWIRCLRYAMGRAALGSDRDGQLQPGRHAGRGRSHVP
jgi:hypothetical protein